MGFWSGFWTVNFIIAGTAFVGIAAVVAVRGVADLRNMLADLRAGQTKRRGK
jgi:UPF0716 family protein affecting phage T7 exclusion